MVYYFKVIKDNLKETYLFHGINNRSKESIRCDAPIYCDQIKRNSLYALSIILYVLYILYDII